MQIKIKVDKSKKLGKTTQSIFIKMPYSTKLMSIVKLIPRYSYDPGTKLWEVPYKYFDNILYLFRDYDLEVCGELPPEAEKELELADMFDSANISNYEFKTKPFDHQLESFAYGMNHIKFLLGDEQGLGKTKQAIDLACARSSQFKHCLIVCCVNGLKWNWKSEIRVHSDKHAHIIGERVTKKGTLVIDSITKRCEELLRGRDEFFLITNIETLRDKNIQAILHDMCQRGDIGMVVIDEIHKCCNPTSSQGKSIHCLTSHYKLALTGTPLMNSPLDVYNPLYWLESEYHSFSQFKNYYCEFGGFGGYEVVRYKHLPELQQMLNDVMLRRRKEDVLDLPPKIRTVEYVEMAKDQAKLYNDIKLEIIDNIDKVLLCPNPLVELTRLRQCTGYPGILSTKITKSVKLDRMEELIKEVTDNGDKAIIFSNWTSVTSEVIQRLEQYNPAVITGETKNPINEQLKFQTEDSCKVIIGTISAMGTGYTLTAGSTIIFLDSPWNRATKDQAEDRGHRIGTTKPVSIITLVAKDTIDEHIENIINKKGAMSDMIVDNFVDDKIDKQTLHLLLS